MQTKTLSLLENPFFEFIFLILATVFDFVWLLAAWVWLKFSNSIETLVLTIGTSMEFLSVFLIFYFLCKRSCGTFSRYSFLHIAIFRLIIAGGFVCLYGFKINAAPCIHMLFLACPI